MAEKLSELAKRLEPFLTKSAMNAARVMLNAGEGPGIDVVNGVVGLGGDSVLLYHSDGSPVSEYAATTNGLVAALAGAVSGDIVLLPAKTIAAPGSASYIPGDEISYGNFNVRSATPITISGLEIGELYAIEGYNGPWTYGNGAWFYGFGASIDGVSYTEFGLHSSSGEILNLPAWGLSVVIQDDGHHGRLFFEASTTTILIKIVDSVYSDNGGALSWRLRTATEQNLLIIPSGVELVGMGKNSVIDGDIQNNGIMTNLKATGTISGSGIVRLVGNPIAETFSRQIKSLLATGTSPFDIASTTVNTNLNSDLLDGKHASELANASHSHAAAEITDFETEVLEITTAEISKISLEELENVIETSEAAGNILQIDDYMEIPGGVESLYDSALLTLSGTGNEANAFNKNITDYWESPSPAPHYVDVTFDRKRFISKVVVTANSGSWMWANHPTGCTVYGSHTGVFGGEETSIITVSGWADAGVYTINITGTRIAYKYYRLVFTRGDAAMWINEIQLYTTPDEFKWVNRTPAGAGLSELGHTHTESEITDLDHDAVKIQGKAVSATTPGDGETLIFNSGTNTYEPGVLTSSLIIEEVDTTPSILNVAKIIVPNGSLIDNEDGSATLDFGSAATDGSAIHDNVASEISAITEKTILAANDMFIIEDSAAGNAKKMVKASNVGGGFYGDVLLRTVVPSGGQDTLDIDSIPSGYDVINIFIQGKIARTDAAVDDILIALNNDTTATNYYRTNMRGYDTSISTNEAEDRFIGWLGTTQDPMYIGSTDITIINPSSPFHKSLTSITLSRRSASQLHNSSISLAWENTSAITRITFAPNSIYKFAEGTLCLIVGYKNH